MSSRIRLLPALVLAAGVLLGSAAGCELIATVDRSKIGTGGAGGLGTGGTGGLGTGGTGGATSSSSSSGTAGGGGAPCTDPATQCPDPGTACILAKCDMGACATENAPVGTACADSDGKVCDGNGACVECADVTMDCPVPPNECVLATCTAGACGTTNVDDGTKTIAGQIDGDCKQQVCDGNGGEKIIDDDTDPQDDGNECTADTCNAGVNVHTNIAGTCTAGGGKVCADPAGPKAGTCVECNTDADCAAPKVCDPVNGSNTCVDPKCTDGKMDGNETGQDCGGPDCGDCPNGEGCLDAGDCQSHFCSSNICAACTGDGDCAGAEFCGTATIGTQGVCAADLGDGSACSSASQCASGSCVDGVCCDTACTGTCNACSAAKKGQGLDGTCGPIAVGQDPDDECTDEGAGSCGNTGACDGAGACQKYAAGTTCRASAGACDVAETCPGGGAACPSDAFQPNTTVCRASAGACDAAETCTGSSADCPADAFLPSSTVCRASAGACDVAETCTGSAADCPADAVAPTTTVCRTSAGACDVAETCDGTSTACPADAFAPSSTVCRASAGACDVAETCTGSSAACPADDFLPNTTVCRAAAGDCDAAETCTGSSADCPVDAFLPNTTVCRASAGACDVAETCTGSSAACPADAVAPNTTVCRPSAGACDVAETCDGTSTACPADGFASNTTVCRAANGACDVAETCTGSSADCPADAFQPNTTVCRASAGVCDVAESCTGSTAACPADGFAAPGTATPTGQAPGDCQKIVCTGANATSTTSVDDPTDIPTSSSACLINPHCSGSPLSPAFDPAPTGTNCQADPGPGNVCGDTSNFSIAGTCVGCNVSADCSGATPVCNTSTHVCEAPVCGNGVIESPEVCDDGNTTSGDGCSSTCSCEATQAVTADPSPNVNIPDNTYDGSLASMTCVNIVVPTVTGCPAQVTSLSVLVAMNHTWIGDLTLKLIHPDATVVTLMSRPGAAEAADDGAETGGTGDSSNLVATFPITFQMGAAVSAENMGNTITSTGNVCQNDGICTFAPARGAAAGGDLNTFIGKPAAGTWKFCASDSGAGDTGSIDAVTLNIGK